MDLQGIPFTKVYRSMLTSSVWTTPHPKLHMIRCVWMTLLMLADKHGYVHSSVPGLAAAAIVSIEEAEEALAVFRAPDPYSRTKDHEGRKLVDTDGGWFLLNYEQHRGTAEHELAKASKRAWYHRNKVTPKTRDPHLARTASSASASSDPDPDQSLAEPDRAEAEPTSAHPCAAPASVGTTLDEPRGQRPVYKNLDGWEPSEELIAEALMQGIARADFDARLAELRNGPIGGARGVFDRDKYVRKQFPRWRQWAEEARSKAVHRAGSTGGGSGTPRRGQAPQGPQGARQTGWGQHVDIQLQRLAEKLGLDYLAERWAFIRSGAIDATETHAEADKLFARHLRERAREVKAGGRKREGE